MSQQDAEDAMELGKKMDRCQSIIKELEMDIATLARSQEYYRKQMRRLAVKRDIKLNLRLL